MSHFKHSHVMGLIGVCLDAGSAPFIIMPYMANGSLLNYLKKERKTIVLLDDENEDEVCCSHNNIQWNLRIMDTLGMSILSIA